MIEILEENNDLKYNIGCLIEVAKKATCHRSKCGSIIVSEFGDIIGEGYNSMPCNDQTECFKDSLDKTFKSDRTCCLHAEQRSIMDALSKNNILIHGSTLFFIRLDENNKPLKAGKPYCTICSKMALDVGISKFILWHEEGWTAYDTKYYNELSFKYKDDAKTNN